jgi:hypothetical protein
MEETMDGMIGLVAAAFAIAASAFVLLCVVPLLAQLRRMIVEAERLLQQLNTGLPPLMRQASQTLEDFDQKLPTFTARE